MHIATLNPADKFTYVQAAAFDAGMECDLESGETHVQVCGLQEPATAYTARSIPRLIRSVVSEAGLGHFVYLQGASGKRYVFSSISPEQVSLYDKALFAATVPGSDVVRVGEKLADVQSGGSIFYVHLLDGAEDETARALADLNQTATQ